MAERARLHELLTAADHPEPVDMAVVHPVDEVSILGAYSRHATG